MNNRIIEAAKAAQDCEIATGLPAALTMAQWALESGWGAHSPGNNCFGITAYEGCFGRQWLSTTEYVGGKPVKMSREFATFPSLTECFIKHSELLTNAPVYRQAWLRFQRIRNVENLTKDIAPHYATDPEYAAKLITLMRSRAISESLGKASIAS